MKKERTWIVRDIDGKNPRCMTKAEFLAEHAQKVEHAMKAFRENAEASGLRVPAPLSR
jgi:tagatose-1,6-bisphosphate aldolase